MNNALGQRLDDVSAIANMVMNDGLSYHPDVLIGPGTRGEDGSYEFYAQADGHEAMVRVTPIPRNQDGEPL